MKTAQEHLEEASRMATLAATAASDARNYNSLPTVGQQHAIVSEAASRACNANLAIATAIIFKDRAEKEGVI